jgi:hypothetical protein
VLSSVSEWSSPGKKLTEASGTDAPITRSDDASSYIEFADAVLVVDCLFSKNAALIFRRPGQATTPRAVEAFERAAIRKFEFALHPDKTRLIRFGRHAAKQREKLGTPD